MEISIRNADQKDQKKIFESSYDLDKIDSYVGLIYGNIKIFKV